MSMIYISDSPSPHLADLLDLIEVAEKLRWTIMDMWAIGRDDDFDVLALEREAASSASGLSMTYVELRAFADRLLQMIDGVVVGYREHPPDRLDADLRSTAEIVLEAVDSSGWRIYARDHAVVDRFRRQYGDVREITPEIAIAPAHDRS